jgi:hypothetical protein
MRNVDEAVSTGETLDAPKLTGAPVADGRINK